MFSVAKYPLAFEKNTVNIFNIDITKKINQTINLLAKKFYSISDNDSAFSPLSIGLILNLLNSVSLKDSNTESQLIDLLGRKTFSGEVLDLIKHIDNRCFCATKMIVCDKNSTIEPHIKYQLRGQFIIYQTDLSNATTTAGHVNSYVFYKTSKLITNVLESNTVFNNQGLIIVDTIYLKANWNTVFDPAKTQKKIFNDRYIVPMMTTEIYCDYYEDDYVQIIELPYKFGINVMGFILPKVSDGNFATYLDTPQINLSSTFVKISIPKFEQRTKINLVQSLKKIGISDLFNSKAKIDGLSPNSFISNFYHEIIISVNETGSEPGIIIAQNQYPPHFITNYMNSNQKIFDANHSFIYYVKDCSKNMLIFVGDYLGN